MLGTINEHLEIDTTDNRVFFGKILGNGAFSVAINVDYPFIDKEVKKEFDYPVLIITKEQEKEQIMKELLEKVYPVDIEKMKATVIEDWLSDNGFDSIEEAENSEDELDYTIEESISEFNLLPTFEKLMDADLCMFYMEKCMPAESDEIKAAVQIIQNQSFGLSQSTSFYEDFSLGLELEDVKNELDNLCIDSVKTGTFKDFIQKVYDVIILTERDIMKIAKTLLNLGVDDICLDIHDQQYLSLDGKVYCSDPFTMEN